MTDERRPIGNRREFLTGRAVRKEVEWVGEEMADAIADVADQLPPSAGPSVRLGTTAMATDFVIMMNPGPPEQVLIASEALEELPALEHEMTVYKDDGELSTLNRNAHAGTLLSVSSRLYEVIQLSLRTAQLTHGAYDPTSGPLIDLWKNSRQDGGIPGDEQISDTLKRCGYQHVSLDESSGSVAYGVEGLELNLGGIGKGFALDCLGRHLVAKQQSNWLMHGGKSSLFASGTHHGIAGWPIGIRNPLFPKERMATLILKNQGMSTSGAGIQFFRHQGKRYGHILDPRTGMPAENVLSVTVLAPTAGEADALSTAFFVMGLEKTRQYCDNHPEIGVMLVPPPQSGRQLKVHTFNLPQESLFLSNHNNLIDESA